MRFRKYSRKHAFNIIYQWDITGEDFSKVRNEYWKTLERSYSNVIELSDSLLSQLDNFNEEVFAKKFEALADEEILADKLRKELYAIFTLLKQLEEFDKFYLTVTEYLSEKNKKRKLKAIELLTEIKNTFEQLKKLDKDNATLLEDIINLLDQIKENFPEDFESLNRYKEEFQQKVKEVLKIYLQRAKEFSQKRLNQDMGEIKEYANRLLDAFEQHQIEIDSIIEEYLKDWTLDRLGSIERNLLRLGTAEFVFVGVQDPGRAFNDYIDFAKAFVGKKAAKFVNGVLSAIYRDKGKKPQEPQPEEKETSNTPAEG
ncbi:MAG: transcription antitermination factor NusB [Aquificota bacterium]|jgi:N utilization substance protein B